MSLWGRLTEMAEKANDAIVDNIAPLLDDSDEEYYSDGEERSFGEDEDSDGLVEDASGYDAGPQDHKDIVNDKGLHLKPSSTCEGDSPVLQKCLGEGPTSKLLETSRPKGTAQEAGSLEVAMEVSSSKVDQTTPQLTFHTHVFGEGGVLANEQTSLPHALNSESVEAKNEDEEDSPVEASSSPRESVGCSQNLSDVSSIESNKMETKRIIPSHNGGARANPIGDQQLNNIGSDATDNEDKAAITKNRPSVLAVTPPINDITLPKREQLQSVVLESTSQHPSSSKSLENSAPKSPPLTKQRLKHAQETAKTAIIAQERMANRCAHAEATVDELQSHIHRLKRQLVTNTNVNNNCKQQLSRANQRIDELKIEIENLNRIIVEKDRDMLEAKSRAEDYGKELRRTIQELDNTNQMNSKNSRDVNNEILTLQERISSLEIMEQKFHTMEADLSSCKADLVMKSEDLNRTTEELDTLRGVLEGFGEELSSTKRKCADEILKIQETTKKEIERSVSQMRNADKLWDTKYNNEIEKNIMLAKKLKENEDTLRKSVAEQAKLKRALDRAAENLSLSHDEELVDRRLVNKLLTTYLDGSQKFDSEVLTLMANILGFTEEQKSKVLKSREIRGQNMSYWLNVGITSTSSAKKRKVPVKVDPNKTNLSELWKSYLIESDED